MLDLKEIKYFVDDKINKSLPSRVFLDTLRVSDEYFRKSLSYNDPRYYPAYYWLGLIINPKSVVFAGFGPGLAGANLARAAKELRSFIGFQEGNESLRLGVANVRDYYRKCKIYNGILENFWQCLPDEYDLGILDVDVGYDKCRTYLDLLWSRIVPEGLLVVDNIKKSTMKAAFGDFCKARNIESVVLNTRCGIGIIRN
jgi:hypothetical protein